MKERPILFSGPMVLAILDGTKTQTRRLVTPQPTGDRVVHAGGALPEWVAVNKGRSASRGIMCPYGVPGDRLWVREAHAIVPRTAYAQSTGVQQTLRPDDDHDAAVYAEGWERSRPGRWRPSIHMPRWASRITLEITGVRVERLQEITEDDARAEGVERGCYHRDTPDGMEAVPTDYRSGFWRLWDQINGKRAPWESNPWVWVLTFKRITAPDGAQEGSDGQ